MFSCHVIWTEKYSGPFFFAFYKVWQLICLPCFIIIVKMLMDYGAIFINLQWVKYRPVRLGIGTLELVLRSPMPYPLSHHSEAELIPCTVAEVGYQPGRKSDRAASQCSYRSGTSQTLSSVPNLSHLTFRWNLIRPTCNTTCHFLPLNSEPTGQELAPLALYLKLQLYEFPCGFLPHIYAVHHYNFEDKLSIINWFRNSPVFCSIIVKIRVLIPLYKL